MALDVNQDLAAYEQHFTIAHEVGHLILERRRIRTALLLGRPSCPAPTQKASDDRLEMMCDFLAEELLIPESWLASKAATYGEPDLTLAIDIASYANVSLFLVIRRLIEMGHLGKQAILWARDNDGTLHATASYPGRDDLTLLGLRVLSDIHKTNPSSSSTLQGTIKILALGEPFEYPFEGVETDSQSIITVLK